MLDFYTLNIMSKAHQGSTEHIWKIFSVWDLYRGFDYRKLLASVEGHAAALLLISPALLQKAVTHHCVLVETWVEVESNAEVITQVDAETGKKG